MRLGIHEHLEVGAKGIDQGLVGEVRGGCEAQHRVRTRYGAIRLDVGAHVNFGFWHCRFLPYTLALETLPAERTDPGNMVCSHMRAAMLMLVLCAAACGADRSPAKTAADDASDSEESFVSDEPEETTEAPRKRAAKRA